LRFKSIKTKLLVWFGAITILVLISFNFAIYQFLEENTKLRIQNKLYTKAAFINRSILAQIPINKLVEDEELKNVDIAIIKDDKIIFQKGKTNFKQFVPLIIKNKESFFVFKQGINLNGLYILRIKNPFKGAILFYEHKIDEKIDNDLKDIKEVLFVLEPMLLFILIFMASKIIDKVLGHINKITNAANKIYVNDLTQKIPKPKYKDEIEDLADAFNRMIKRLKEGVDTLEQFNSDVSHELKTPLTVIKGEIEIALNKPRDEEYYKNSLQVIESETQQIQTIVDNLLLLTKYNKDNITQTFKECSLDSLILQIIDKYQGALKNKQIKIQILKFEPSLFYGNETLLHTMFSNLLDNAIKYSPQNKTIFISLFTNKSTNKIQFTIQDQGIGINKELLPKITNRFYRVDSSRNKKIKGFGLGLAIVKNSVDLHNGKIKISSKENTGTKIKIIL